jgi:membrane protein DedA with SNARE-associated domain
VEHLEHLIRTYGYWALLVGTFLEGETILIIAGAVAAQGLLDVHFVMLSAFAGSVAGDQLHFFIGRYKGQWILSKFANQRERLEKVLRLVERHSILLVLVFRFMYGLRNLSSFALGMTRMPIWLYAPLNAVGAAVWAAAFASAGYLFGYAVLPVLTKAKHYQLKVLGVVSVVAMAIWLIRVWRARWLIRRKAVSAAQPLPQ